jgi:protein-tyrosine phosphatase
MRTRDLHWPDLVNVRDLGGLKTADGRAIRRGAFVRADSPHNMSQAGFDALRVHGVRTVLDLRMDRELAQLPNPLSGQPDLHFHQVSLIGGPGDPQYIRDAGLSPHSEWVTMMLDLAQARFADAMRVIARAPAGGVLYHCYAGKDRTGLITDILLSLVGVPDDVIAEDYVLTNERVFRDSNPMFAAMKDPEQRQRMVGEWRVYPETAHTALARIRAIGGDTRGFLTHIGVSDADIDAIKQRLI